MQLIDVHCHLESIFFKDNLDVIIEDARNAGLIRLISSTTEPTEWDYALSIARSYKEVECAIGIHPWYITSSDIDKLDLLYNAKQMGAIAIGEIGLDKKIDSPDFFTQIVFFKKQIAIAASINVPVITHCRGGFNEFIEIIKKSNIKKCGGIIHNFTGSLEIAEELIKHNFMFSLGGILTYKLSKKRENMLKAIYPDYFLLETDSPDIVPVPLHNKPNVPANILLNLSAAAKILNKPIEEIASVTTKNAKKILNL